jgi:hypothetical protein
MEHFLQTKTSHLTLLTFMGKCFRDFEHRLFRIGNGVLHFVTNLSHQVDANFFGNK